MNVFMCLRRWTKCCSWFFFPILWRSQESLAQLMQWEMCGVSSGSPLHCHLPISQFALLFFQCKKSSYIYAQRYISHHSYKHNPLFVLSSILSLVSLLIMIPLGSRTSLLTANSWGEALKAFSGSLVSHFGEDDPYYELPSFHVIHVPIFCLSFQVYWS